MQKNNIGVILLLIFVSLIVYANSFKNEFVWDDESLIENNNLIRDYRNIIRIFTTHLFAGVNSKSNFYRPIQNLSYLFDYLIWRLNPLGYHITNTVIHIINSILAYFIILIISKNNLISLLTSLLFSVHPIHTEAVTYISGRADPLCVLFGLLSISMFLKYRLAEIRLKQVLYYSISLVAFVLSLLSKEIAVIFPFLIILSDYVVTFKKKRSLYSYLIFFLILSIYGILRNTALKFPSNESILASLSIHSRLFTTVYVITQYFWIILFPFNLHMERQVTPAISFFEPRIILSIVFLFLISFFILRNIRKLKLISFGVGWFFISLLPVSNIFPLNALMAEHWLYLPSLGIFFIIAIGLNRLIQSKLPEITSVGFVIFICIYFSFLIIKQNFIWKDTFTFYQYLLKFSPSNARVHYNLANSFRKIGIFDEAILEYKRAIALRPQYPDAHTNLGVVYLKKEEFKEAAKYFIESLNLNPSDLQTLINLAETYRYLREFDKAVDIYKRVISVNPGNIQTHINLGATYAMKNNYVKAIEEYEVALNLTSDSTLKAKIYFNLGSAYMQLGKVDIAKNAWHKALKFDADLKQARENLEKLREIGY